MKILYLFLLISCSLVIFVGCDPERRKQCEWYLVPDLDRKTTVDNGYIPVCARNYTSKKQDCRLQATLEFAQNAYNKKFRYVDMKIKSPGIPRTVLDIKFCE